MQQNLQNICAHMEQGLIERSSAVRLSLLSALSGEHLLLLGPPGTAKSLLARKLQHAFQSVNYFERMLTRFSVPEELFGPLSIKALEQDKYHRLTDSYLPEAGIAFIDEIFKANSAILNSLLTLLNEREFDNGAERTSVPLISVIAASNELPYEEELEALYDRFLVRFNVQPVSDDSFDLLLDVQLDEYEEVNFKPLTAKDIESIQTQALSIKLDDNARSLLHSLRQFLSTQDIYISDRRWKKSFSLLQVSACTNDQSTITDLDCLLLINVLWNEPQQKEIIDKWFLDHLKLDIEPTIQRIEKLVKTWESQLDQDVNKFYQKKNSNGDYLYLNTEGEPTTQHQRVTLAERNGETLYLAPPGNDDRTNDGKGYTLQELESVFFDKSFKQTHIDGRWVDVHNYINNTQNRLVEKIMYTPLVEDFYFSRDYVDNQLNELNSVVIDIEKIVKHYELLQSQLSDIIENHLWLKLDLLIKSRNDIDKSLPRLIDFQQRIQVLQGLNRKLKVKAPVPG